MAGAWLPRYRTRSALASASSSTVTEPGPAGASVITAFIPLRWSAATIRILPAGVEMAAMARRSSVVSSFIAQFLVFGLVPRCGTSGSPIGDPGEGKTQPFIGGNYTAALSAQAVTDLGRSRAANRAAP